MAVGDHRPDHLRVALRRHGHGEHGERHVASLEQLEQAPDPGAAAVFVERFHAHVAHALQGLGSHHLGKERLGLLVAMQDAALATFFVIEHEGQGDAGIAGPVRVGRVVAVSDQVAWVVSAHSSVPYCGWGGGPDGPGMP